MARPGQQKSRRAKAHQERQAEKARLAANAAGISILPAASPISAQGPSASPANSSTSEAQKKGPPSWAGPTKTSVTIPSAPLLQATAVTVDADGFYDIGDEGVEEGDAEWAASYEADAMEDEDEDRVEDAPAGYTGSNGYERDEIAGEDDGDDNALKTIHVQPSAQRSSGYDLGPYTGAILDDSDIMNGASSAAAASTLADTAGLASTGVADDVGAADREALGPGKKRKRDQMGNESRTERRRAKGGDGGGGAGSGPACLPVASLPKDWHGEVLDGATYLATVQRANQSLPDYTRVDNPYEVYYEQTASSSSTIDGGPVHANQHRHRGRGKGKSTTKSSAALEADTPRAIRHPALPKESWAVLFPLHFQAYKERLATSWPPSPRLPYPSTWPPVPNSTSRLEWSYYINGAPRRWVRQRKPLRPDDGGGEADMELDEDEDEDDAGKMAGGKAEMEMEMDEEALMNASAEQHAAIARKEEERAKAEEDSWEEVQEPFEERHRSREPVLSALQGLETSRIVAILGNMSDQISTALETCEAELDLSSLTQPGTAPNTTSNDSTPSRNQTPLNERYSRWIFALLGILESPLSASQTSALRELARVVMRVGAWRWVKAVTASEVGLPVSAGADEGEASDQSRAPPWVLGARWKYHRDIVPPAERKIQAALPPREQTAPRERESFEEASVDETLARCWMIVYAIAAGWAQWDLVADLENMFS